MHFHVLTLFPEMIEQGMNTSIMGRAIERGYISLKATDIRDYAANKHNKVDDTPYGGGAGMVMMAQPVFDALRSVGAEKKRIIYMSPRGRRLDGELARSLAQEEDLVFLCGHYEGIDERVSCAMDEELSIGDYVLTGGELGALVLVDCIGRMVEGVLPSEECFTEESHWNGLLEYPQYTHPVEWNGRRIPDILLSGDHGKIAKWRHEMSLRNTLIKRPDLLEKAELSQKDRWLVAQMKAEQAAKDGNDSNAAQTDGETDRK
mgnify:CR=1 FL=1